MDSLSWARRGGPGLEARGLRLGEPRSEAPPFFKAGSFFLRVEPLGLFMGRVVVSAAIEEGHLHYRYGSEPPFFDLEISDIKAELEGILLGGTLKGKGEGRVFDESSPDLKWQGTLRPADGPVDFEIALGEGRLIATGEGFPHQSPPRFGLEFEANDFDLEGAFRRFQKGTETEWIPAGRVFGRVELQGSGREWGDLQNSLSGVGRLEIREGAIRNLNLVKAVLARITVVPGLGEVLAQAAPAPFQPLLNHRDTTFEALEVNFHVQGDQLAVESLILKESQYVIEGSGTVGLAGVFDLRAKLVLLEEISGFLIQKVGELGYLANEQGRIVIPFVLRGKWPEVRPEPDLAYLAEKLIVDQGARLMEWGLETLSQAVKGSE